MSQADASSLPQETIHFAHRIFDAARNGNSELLLAAVDAGLPVNLTNDKATNYLSLFPSLAITDRQRLEFDFGFALSSLGASSVKIPGNTLLMLAAYAGHASLTQELLNRGADPNRLNDLGQSMIAGAVFKGHIEVVRALAAKNADPRLGQPNALQAAYMFGRTELFKELGGTDVDITPNVPPPLSAAN